MQVPHLEQGGLLGAQPGVVKRPEERVVPPGGGELAGYRDSFPQELEEAVEALLGGRRHGVGGVDPHVATEIECIQRVLEVGTEQLLDLGGPSCAEEGVEPLECLEVASPGRAGKLPAGQLAHHPVDLFCP